MAISMVVGHNEEACIRYLLERGAIPTLGPNCHARGPISEQRAIMNSGVILHRAAVVCPPEIFALLLSHDGAVPLHRAAGHRHP